MGLPWVKLATSFAANPKVLGLVEDRSWRAISVYAFALGWSGEHGTDGFIPAAALPFIHATKREANALVEARLWMPAPGGWDINSWSEHQRSTDETRRRSEHAKKAASARWTAQRSARGNASGTALDSARGNAEQKRREHSEEMDG